MLDTRWETRGGTIIRRLNTISDEFGYWFAGITDGEGSFNISIFREKHPSLSFHIGLRIDDASTILYIRDTLGIGRVCAETLERSTRKRFIRFGVTSVPECVQLVSVFERYPLQSKKKNDFILWSEAVKIFSSNYITPKQKGRYHKYPWKDERNAKIFSLKTQLETGRQYNAEAVCALGL